MDRRSFLKQTLSSTLLATGAVTGISGALTLNSPLLIEGQFGNNHFVDNVKIHFCFYV